MKQLLATALSVAALGWGQAFLNPTNGANGALNLPAGGTPAQVRFRPADFPNGVDSDNVYHFTSINIASGRQLYIPATEMNTSGPIIFLVQGNVTIDGTVYLGGENGLGINGGQPTPGPGGFTAGHGPGAPGVTSTPGFASTFPPISPCGAVHAVAAPAPCNTSSLPYGSSTLLPLIGGSGGGNTATYWGGSGGGAIRIVAGGTITIGSTGEINANGGATVAGFGSGGGSSGAIHLVAPTVTLAPGVRLNAPGGRARIDSTNSPTATSIAAGTYEKFGLPDAPIPLPLPGSIQVRVGGVTIPANADAALAVPDAQFTATGTPLLEVTAKNIPPGTAVHAVCKPTGGGPNVTVALPLLSGTFDLSTTSASLPLTTATARCAVQAHW